LYVTHLLDSILGISKTLNLVVSANKKVDNHIVKVCAPVECAVI